MRLNQLNVAWCIAAVAVASVTARGTADIQTGLIAYWSFDAPGGATVADSSGNGHAGEIIGVVIPSSDACPFPASRYSLDFGDLGGFVRVPDHPALDPTGDFTLAAWVKNRASATYNGGDFILDKHFGGINNDGSWFWWLAPLNTPHSPTSARQGFIATPWALEYEGGAAFGLNEWHHVALVYERSADRCLMYVDGVALGSTQVWRIADNPAPLHIGGQDGAADFAGLLDEVRMYSRALAAADIHELVHGPCILTHVESFDGPYPGSWTPIGNGSWSFGGGVACQSVGADDDLALLKFETDHQFTDFDLTVRWQQTGGGEISSGLLLHFRMGDDPGPGADVPGVGPHYALSWTRTPPHYGSPDMCLTRSAGYRLESPNAYRPIGEVLACTTLNEQQTWFQLNDWRRTRVRVVGNRIRVLVDYDSSNPGADAEADFVPVLEATDAAIESGAVAINDHFGTSCWDSVIVRPIRRGDVNCDCMVDFFDVDPFLLALFDPAAFALIQPNCSPANADFDDNLITDFFDVDPFLECLFDTLCP